MSKGKKSVGKSTEYGPQGKARGASTTGEPSGSNPPPKRGRSGKGR